VRGQGGRNRNTNPPASRGLPTFSGSLGIRFDLAFQHRRATGVEDRWAGVEAATIERTGERVFVGTTEPVAAPRTEAAVRPAGAAALARRGVADTVAAKTAIDGTGGRRFSERALAVTAPRRRSAVEGASEEGFTRTAEAVAAERDGAAVLRARTKRPCLARIADAISADGRPAIERTIERSFTTLAHEITAKAPAVLRTRLCLARLAPPVAANQTAVGGTGHRLARIAHAVAAERESTIDRTAEGGLERLADGIATSAAAAIDRTGDGLVVLADPIAANALPAVLRAAELCFVRVADAIAAEGRKAAVKWTIGGRFSALANSITADDEPAVDWAILRSLSQFADRVAAERHAAVLRTSQWRLRKLADFVTAARHAASRRRWSARHGDAGAAIAWTGQ